MLSFDKRNKNFKHWNPDKIIPQQDLMKAENRAARLDDIIIHGAKQNTASSDVHRNHSSDSSPLNVALTVMDIYPVIQTFCTRFLLCGGLDIVILDIGLAVATPLIIRWTLYHLRPQAFSMPAQILVFWESLLAHCGQWSDRIFPLECLKKSCLNASSFPRSRRLIKSHLVEIG